MSTRTQRKVVEAVELWEIGRLKPHAGNDLRIHPESQLEELAESIARFGFNEPIVVDESEGILSGKARLIAAQRLELSHVPVVVVTHLNEKEKRAWILAANRISELGRWDEDHLAKELADLSSHGIEFSGMGFTLDDMDNALRVAEQIATDLDTDAVDEGETQPEAPPEPEAKPPPRLISTDEAWAVWNSRVRLKAPILEYAPPSKWTAPESDELERDVWDWRELAHREGERWTTIVVNHVLERSEAPTVANMHVALLQRMVPKRDGRVYVAIDANIPQGVRRTRGGSTIGASWDDWRFLLGRFFTVKEVPSPETLWCWDCRL